ncbi:MAG TPA: hypothetical protein DCO77_08120 [Nitrospiraceae bacterium]|nr:hypothetical protein [Nitrospiraceae bacterium]
MTITSTIVIGTILLILLCWNDFRAKILRPKSQSKYYAAFAFFCVVNIAIYFLILRIVLEKDPVKILLATNTGSFSGPQIFQPLLVSLLYFGAGAKTFRLGTRQFNLYQTIIKSFQQLFRMSWDKISEIRQSIETAPAPYAKLKAKIDRLQEKARILGWENTQDSKLQGIAADTNMAEEQIKALKEMYKGISAEPLSHKDIEDLKNDMQTKIAALQEAVTNKLKTYLFLFIFKYIKDESEIEAILQEIDVPPPQAAPSQTPNVAYRSLVISFLFGMLFGPIYYLSNNFSPVEYGWYGAFSLGVFGLVMSFIKMTEHKFKSIVNVVVLGALAGAAGFLTWGLLSTEKPMAEALKGIAARSIIGVQFGAGISLVLYAFRMYLRKKKTPTALNYGAVGLSGSIVFVLLTMANMYGSKYMILESYIAIGAVGMVVMMAMAFALDIFSEDAVQ